MSVLEQIKEFYPDVEFTAFEGLDEAVIGVVNDELLVYSATKCVEIFKKRDGMTHEEALEFYEYNVVGTKSKKMPILCDDLNLNFKK